MSNRIKGKKKREFKNLNQSLAEGEEKVIFQSL